jgi:hypothetical protein
MLLYITYRQPHFVNPILNRNSEWNMEMVILGGGDSSFEYFGFIATVPSTRLCNLASRSLRSRPLPSSQILYPLENTHSRGQTPAPLSKDPHWYSEQQDKNM